MVGRRKIAVSLIAALAMLCVAPAAAQECVDGQCQTLQPITINPLFDVEKIELTGEATEVATAAVDRFERVVEATCRVTVSGVCGSGTVVGRDSEGNALVLTNAHVAGTRRGRIVQLQRWNTNGKSERGQGAIIASGYGRGLSIDFALLKCNSGFAKGVQPIPLADRYPDTKAGVSTYGCPRCEWPSMQVLSMTRDQGQVLKWKPEAIGGRSGSSLIDYTDAGPRVVGLLTWGGGGEGLGQSTPFLLNAMRGRMPRSFEVLPPGVREVSTLDDPIYPSAAPLNPNRSCNLPEGIGMKPCGTNGEALPACTLHAGDDCDGTTQMVSFVVDETSEAECEPIDQQDGVIDDIVEDGPDAKPDSEDDCGLLNRDRDKDKPKRPGIGGRVDAIRDTIRFWLVVAGVAAVSWLAGRFLPFPR